MKGQTYMSIAQAVVGNLLASVLLKTKS